MRATDGDRGGGWLFSTPAEMTAPSKKRVCRGVTHIAGVAERDGRSWVGDEMKASLLLHVLPGASAAIRCALLFNIPD